METPRRQGAFTKIESIGRYRAVATESTARIRRQQSSWRRNLARRVAGELCGVGVAAAVSLLHGQSGGVAVNCPLADKERQRPIGGVGGNLEVDLIESDGSRRETGKFDRYRVAVQI